MTTPNLKTREGMPLVDFLEQQAEKQFELIHGERVEKMPTVAGHNEIIDVLYRVMRRYADAHKLGMVRMEATFVIPENQDDDTS